jgi:hypothetical protein
MYGCHTAVTEIHGYCHTATAMHLHYRNAPTATHLLPCTYWQASAAMQLLPRTYCRAPIGRHLLPDTYWHASQRHIHVYKEMRANCSGVSQLHCTSHCSGVSQLHCTSHFSHCDVVVLTKTQTMFRTQNGHSCSPKQRPNDISRDTPCTNFPDLPSTSNNFIPIYGAQSCAADS